MAQVIAPSLRPPATLSASQNTIHSALLEIVNCNVELSHFLADSLDTTNLHAGPTICLCWQTCHSSNNDECPEVSQGPLSGINHAHLYVCVIFPRIIEYLDNLLHSVFAQQLRPSSLAFTPVLMPESNRTRPTMSGTFFFDLNFQVCTTMLPQVWTSVLQV
jgi:hypothetical protein